MQGKALPGFRDFYPDALALRNHIFATWRTVARRYGFEEYDGPPLETLELYTRKSGEEIVAQLYSFKDKGDREVALRAFGSGLEHVRARISERRVLRALLLGRGLTEAQLTAAFAGIDRAEREQPAAVEARLIEQGVGKQQAKVVLETAQLRGLDQVT